MPCARCGELVLDPLVRYKLLAMSPATIDRRLAPAWPPLGDGSDQRPVGHQAGQLAQGSDPDSDFRRLGRHPPPASPRPTWSPIAEPTRRASSARPDRDRPGQRMDRTKSLKKA